jgi:NADP-reducing hydrogenase subunit HndB
MARLNVDDLKQIKESMKGVFNLRGGDVRTKIIVHMGECGLKAGARKIMESMFDKLKKSGARDVVLTASDCAGMCDLEPMITVEEKDTPPVTYTKIDTEKAARIFDEHVIGGRPVAEYALSKEGDPPS